VRARSCALRPALLTQLDNQRGLPAAVGIPGTARCRDANPERAVRFCAQRDALCRCARPHARGGLCAVRAASDTAQRFWASGCLSSAARLRRGPRRCGVTEEGDGVTDRPLWSRAQEVWVLNTMTALQGRVEWTPTFPKGARAAAVQCTRPARASWWYRPAAQGAARARFVHRARGEHRAGARCLWRVRARGLACLARPACCFPQRAALADGARRDCCRTRFCYGRAA
jgi:hypothetical protein